MKNLNKRILEAINSDVRMSLSLDDFNNTDDKLPTLKKDIKSKSENNYIKACKLALIDQCETLQFDDDFIKFLDVCKDFTYKPSDNEHLKQIIKAYIEQIDIDADLNWIDTSEITDMSNLFAYSEFNGDISKWDVSNVTDMGNMFYSSKFNGDISQWDVSKVTNMSNMFAESDFNGNNDISEWNVSHVKFMDYMFQGTHFHGDISKWDVSHVINMEAMFQDSTFNGDISKWDVSYVINMESMFDNTEFNQDISAWDVTAVETTENMFANSSFSGDLSLWNLKNLEKISYMFYDSYSQVCTLRPENIKCFIDFIEHPSEIALIQFNHMFEGWDSENLPEWYNDMKRTYIKNNYMKNLNKKILEAINSGVRMGLSLDDFDDTNNKLPTLKKNIQSQHINVIKDSEYLLSEQCTKLEFDENTESYLRVCKNFKYKPKDDNAFKKLVREFLKQTGNYEANLNWIDTSKITSMSHLFVDDMDGMLRYSLDERYDSQFNGDISKWDVSNVKDMSGLFFRCPKFNGDISKWNVSNVKDMSEMFQLCKNFNNDISNWDVSNVKNMSNMFACCKFNRDISKWDVSNVTDMSFMFYQGKFNKDISNWNVSNVKDMQAMFSGSLFNGDISKWNVSKLKNIQTLFHGSKFTGVNGDISKWDVSNVSKVDGGILSSKITKDAQEKILSIWTSKNPKFSKYFHFIKFMK